MPKSFNWAKYKINRQMRNHVPEEDVADQELKKINKTKSLTMREQRIVDWKEANRRRWRQEGIIQRIISRHNEHSAEDRGMLHPVYYDIKSYRVAGRVKIYRSVIVDATQNLKYMIGDPYGLLLNNCSIKKWTCTKAPYDDLYES